MKAAEVKELKPDTVVVFDQDLPIQGRLRDHRIRRVGGSVGYSDEGQWALIGSPIPGGAFDIVVVACENVYLATMTGSKKAGMAHIGPDGEETPES